jgi:hypothetical protein
VASIFPEQGQLLLLDGRTGPAVCRFQQFTGAPYGPGSGEGQVQGPDLVRSLKTAELDSGASGTDPRRLPFPSWLSTVSVRLPDPATNRDRATGCAVSF